MATKVAVPPDIGQILDALDSVSTDVERLFSTCDSNALVRSPVPGGWSASQCVAHLAATNFAYVTAMRAAVKPVLHLHNHERSGPISPGRLTRWFLAHLEPPPRHRVRASRRVSPPSIVQPYASLREFQQSQTAVRDLLLECRHLDLNHIRFPNPFIPGLRFTAGAGFLIIAAHERRHLWQAIVATSEV